MEYTGGITYKPKKADIKLTLGYGNITTGSYGADTVSNKRTVAIYFENGEILIEESDIRNGFSIRYIKE